MRAALALVSALVIGATSLAAAPPGSAVTSAATPVTNITINGNGGDRVYEGVGAVLGGGGNARYLMDYPARQRTEILNDLFKQNYGASLQLLKLEIGGDANSSDGAEPSVEHAKGQITCDAGYELPIAQQAQAINPDLRLYGLQWTAPGWVADGGTSLFTADDVQYLLDWLGCARKYDLKVGYLGGWNETDPGTHADWFHQLRQALDAHGYGSVKIVAGDQNGSAAADWAYAGDPDVQVLGAHDVCGYPTGAAGGNTTCTSTSAAQSSGQSLWASELGAMDAGAQTGCTVPCAPALDRALVRGYLDAKLTGYLQWPALDSMPPNLPYENRGIVTADQPWSGSYSLNAMAWATAHLTQFVWPPNPGNQGGWKYIDSASGYLQGNRTDGSYVSLVRSPRNAWSSVIETTAGVSTTQQVHVTVTGGLNLASKTVHVWASNFDFATDSPDQWFVRQPDITPSNGQFDLTVKPGWVYSLTTTTGQSKAAATPPAATPMPLPYSDDLSTTGNAGTLDDEPSGLAAMDGSFELAPCQVPDGTATTCTQQTTPALPVLWAGGSAPASDTRYPYAVIGDNSWTNYTVASDVLYTQAGTSAGLVGRFTKMPGQPNVGDFDGYVFDAASDGTWKIVENRTASEGGPITLATGQLATALGTGSWHRLSLTLSGGTLTAGIDGQQVGGVTDTHFTAGPAGLEAGAFTHTWPGIQYSHLTVDPA